MTPSQLRITPSLWATRVKKMAVVAAVVLVSAPIHAQDRAGDFEVVLGAAELVPNTSSTPLGIVSPMHQTVPGSGFTTGNLRTLGFTLRYWSSDRTSWDFLGGIPRASSIAGTGSLSAGTINPLGHTTALSPSLMFRYHFLEASNAWRPSLAVGLNYTQFVKSSVSPQFQQALSSMISSGASSAFPSTLSFSSSWNPAFGAGLSFRLNSDWKIDLTATYVPLRTTGTIHTNTGGVDVISQGSMKVNPTIWNLGLSRRF
jgi:outer membrane protein